MLHVLFTWKLPRPPCNGGFMVTTTPCWHLRSHSVPRGPPLHLAAGSVSQNTNHSQCIQNINSHRHQGLLVLCFHHCCFSSAEAGAFSFLFLIQLQDEIPLLCFFPYVFFLISLSLTSLILVSFCATSSLHILLHFMSAFLIKAIFFFFPLCLFCSLKQLPRVTSAISPNIQLLLLTPNAALQQLYLFPFSTFIFRFPISIFYSLLPISKFLLPTSTDHLSLIFRNSPTSFKNKEIPEWKILKAEC